MNSRVMSVTRGIRVIKGIWEIRDFRNSRFIAETRDVRGIRVIRILV
jgi:hypothetical protein